MGVKIFGAPEDDEDEEEVEKQETKSNRDTEDTETHKKVKDRRATKVISEGDPILQMLKKQKGKQLKVFKASPRWWTKASYVYAFSHPHVRSRLEKLMGSNLVSLTDRQYMQKLQERILEDYTECMEKRIKVREEEEMERVKNLVLSGKIPLSKAPHSMWDHPVMVIERYCNKLIAERRAKIKIPKVIIPTYVYYDDTPDPPSGLSIEKGHVFRPGVDKLCHPFERFLPEEEEECTHINLPMDMLEDESDDIGAEAAKAEIEGEGHGADDEEEEEPEPILDDYMYTRAELMKLKYEDPLIKKLRRCKTVEEMYSLAEEIVGIVNEDDDALGQTLSLMSQDEDDMTSNVESTNQEAGPAAQTSAEADDLDE